MRVFAGLTALECGARVSQMLLLLLLLLLLPHNGIAHTMPRTPPVHGCATLLLGEHGKQDTHQHSLGSM